MFRGSVSILFLTLLCSWRCDQSSPLVQRPAAGAGHQW